MVTSLFSEWLFQRRESHDNSLKAFWHCDVWLEPDPHWFVPDCPCSEWFGALEGRYVAEYVCARTLTRPRWKNRGRTADNIKVRHKEEGEGQPSQDVGRSYYLRYRLVTACK